MAPFTLSSLPLPLYVCLKKSAWNSESTGSKGEKPCSAGSWTTCTVVQGGPQVSCLETEVAGVCSRGHLHRELDAAGRATAILRGRCFGGKTDLAKSLKADLEKQRFSFIFLPPASFRTHQMTARGHPTKSQEGGSNSPKPRVHRWVSTHLTPIPPSPLSHRPQVSVYRAERRPARRPHT